MSNRSIRRYRWRWPVGSPSQTWRTFLANHAHHLWAADLLTVQTLTFKTLYVLIFIAHGGGEIGRWASSMTAEIDRVRSPTETGQLLLPESPNGS